MATATYEKQETRSALARPVWSVLELDWEKAAYLALLVLAFVTRFYDLGTRVMSHDESLHTQYAWYLYANGNYAHDPVMHGPLKFHLTAFTYWLFGDNDFTARIPSALMGVAAVGLCYFFRKWIGRVGALAAAVLMLISPYQLYYSRYIRDEPYVMVWGLLMALMILNYMDTRAPKFLYGLAAVSALFYATMETSFIYTAIFMVFLGLHFILDLYSRPWPAGSDSTRRTFTTVLSIGLAAAAIGVTIFLYKDRLGTSGTFFAPSATQPDRPAQSSSPLTVWADIAWLVALACGVVSLWLVMRAFGPNVRRFASLDLIMVMGVFALPQLAAFPVKMMGFNPINYALPPMQPFDFFALINSDAFVTGAMTVFLIAASVLVGYI
ncbi:MAG: TIGR03663 family protein, partial [Anaerolineales bacterium]|nr:TIGR03663 family protein [Anaerolineales bacterium]